MTQSGYYNLSNPRALGVGIWLSRTTFHDISVREVAGKGKLLRGAAAPAPAAVPSTGAQ